MIDMWARRVRAWLQDGGVLALWALLGWLVLPWAAALLLLWHGGRGEWRRLRQTLGWASAADLAPLAGSEVVWVHAVSAGEVQAAKPLLEHLQAGGPRPAVWFSVGTRAGWVVAEGLRLAAAVGWLPLDAPPCCRLALERLRPRLLILLETEIWPNLVSACHRRGVPVVLANGRIDDASYRGYRRWRFLFAPVLGRYERILAESPEAAGQFARLGARPGGLRVCGNLKVDATPAAPDPELRCRWRALLGLGGGDLLLVGGSTHEGEEDMLLEVLDAARAAGLPLRLLLAPRHPVRVPGLGRRLSRRGRAWALRSRLPSSAAPEIVLLDTLGELPAAYAAADLVLVGKSFSVGGGQNPAEPAAWGCALVFGPAMQSFAALAEALVAEGGAWQVRNGRELQAACLSLLTDAQRRTAMGERARRAVATRRQAVACTMAEIEPLLRRAGPADHLQRRASATPAHRPRRD